MAIWNVEASPLIANNLITGTGWTGIGNDRSAPKIINNLITHHGDSGVGNWNSDFVITNNTIVGNGRNGIYNIYSSGVVINNIIADNRESGVLNGGSSPEITHNSLWGNGTDVYSYYYSYPIVADNVSSNPLFVDSNSGDYHLQAGSPCIDAGLNTASGLPEMDFDGKSRIVDGDGDAIAIIDMGAYEFQTPQTITDIIAAVHNLLSVGIISNGTATSLTSVLNSALTQQQRGNVQASYRILGAFINQVKAQARAGKITQEAANLLIEAANLQIAK